MAQRELYMPKQRGAFSGLAATCVRHIAVEPSERGGGLVFHAVDLRRANIYELIEEAVV